MDALKQHAGFRAGGLGFKSVYLSGIWQEDAHSVIFLVGFSAKREGG